jgi:DNA-binding XRE family transcriptional regulator
MQAVVKTPHIEINIKGEMIPQKLIYLLQEEYGDEVKVTENDEDNLINVVETQWYEGIKENLTPGGVMRIYRENRAMTQTRLGELLGGIPRQHVSNMETGKRPISLNTAKKLAKLFNIPIERLLV